MNQDIQGTICYLQDKDGNSHFPITSVEAVVGPDYNLKTKLSELNKKITDLQGSEGSQGPQGPQGEQGVAGEDGATFTPSISEEGVLTWTNDKGLENPISVNIKGPQGEKGLQGETGAKGEKGDKGDSGAPFAIKKVYGSVEEMQSDFDNSDSNVQVNEFVLITTGNVSDEDNAKLYIKGAEGFEFLTDLSGSQGIQGPKGDKGDTGEQGLQGPKGDTGENSNQAS